MSVVAGKSPLQTLHVQGQSSTQDEGHMVEIFTKLAGSLGIAYNSFVYLRYEKYFLFS